METVKALIVNSLCSVYTRFLNMTIIVLIPKQKSYLNLLPLNKEEVLKKEMNFHLLMPSRPFRTTRFLGNDLTQNMCIDFFK